jgi:hypothetical protein
LTQGAWQDAAGMTALHWAAATGDARAVHSLLSDTSANVAVRTVHGFTPAMLALREGHVDLARLLTDALPAYVSLRIVRLIATHTERERETVAAHTYLDAGTQAHIQWHTGTGT